MFDHAPDMFSPENILRYPFLALWQKDEPGRLRARLQLIDDTMRELAAHRQTLTQRLEDLERLPPLSHRALLDE